MKDEKRVTVKVPGDLHQAAKVEAAKQGRSLSEIVREMLLFWLKAKKDDKNG